VSRVVDLAGPPIFAIPPEDCPADGQSQFPYTTSSEFLDRPLHSEPDLLVYGIRMRHHHRHVFVGSVASCKRKAGLMYRIDRKYGS